MFKLREMRGAGIVEVKHLPTDNNTADIFTKILPRPVFERHRKVLLNLAGGEGMTAAMEKMKSGKG